MGRAPFVKYRHYAGIGALLQTLPIRRTFSINERRQLVRNFYNTYTSSNDFSCDYTTQSSSSLGNQTHTKTKKSVLLEAQGWISSLDDVARANNCPSIN